MLLTLLVGAPIYLPGIVFAAREIWKLDGEYIREQPVPREITYFLVIFSWLTYVIYWVIGRAEARAGL
jgi:hypothetical protein